MKHTITVMRPDPETGEIREEVVPRNHFAPDVPRWPTPDDPDREEREAEFWCYYESALTPKERSSISRGAFALLRPQPPTWGKGDCLEVASRITVTVEEIDDTEKGYRTTFCVRNDRPALLRRVPGVFEPPKLDKSGYPIKPTAEAIEDARIDGNYTSSAALAVDDAGDAMDDTLYARIHGEVDAANAIRGVKQSIKAEKMELEMKLAEARRRGRRGKVRHLEKEIERHDRREDRAA